jgi:hypothetical protein
MFGVICESHLELSQVCHSEPVSESHPERYSCLGKVGMGSCGQLVLWDGIRLVSSDMPAGLVKNLFSGNELDGVLIDLLAATC